MTDTPVSPWLRRTCAEILGAQEDQLTPDALLAEDLEADSLDLAEINEALTNEGVALTPEEVAEIRTFGDLAKLVAARAAAGSPR